MTDVKGSGEAVENMLPLTLSFWVNDGHQVAAQTVQELGRDPVHINIDIQ